MATTDLTPSAPVLVTGATGSTGGAVLEGLLRRGVPVRAMVRKTADAEQMRSRGAEAVLGDFDDRAAVATALDGASGAYLVTPSSERAESQQLAFVEGAAEAGVEHLVVLSQLSARTDSPVRFLRYHAVVEDRVRELDLGWTFLRPNLFFQGLLAFAPSVAAGGSIAAPIGEALVSAIDVRDIGEVGAAVFAERSHLGEVLTLTGPQALSHPQMADHLAAALGRPVGFAEVSDEDFIAALDGVLPTWQLEGLVEDYAHYGRGEAADVTTTVTDVTGAAARSFEAFAAEHADAFR